MWLRYTIRTGVAQVYHTYGCGSGLPYVRVWLRYTIRTGVAQVGLYHTYGYGQGLGNDFFWGGGKNVDMPSDCQNLGGAHAYPSP